MSYNGIGLQSARGSGTSGHIQANIASNKGNTDPELTSGHYRKRRSEEKLKRATRVVKPSMRFKDQKREDKRKLEIRCLEIRDDLEEKGVPEAIIVQKINEVRKLSKEENCKLEEKKKLNDNSTKEKDSTIEMNQEKSNSNDSTESSSDFQYKPRFPFRDGLKDIR